jgi:hypothetical protein
MRWLQASSMPDYYRRLIRKSEIENWKFPGNPRIIIFMDRMATETSYTPVPYECREVIQEQLAKGAVGKIFFFDQKNVVDSVEARLTGLEEVSGAGLFITLDSGMRIRIDRIITLFGKPGAAYDEYDAFANQCLSCTGGYEL